MGQTFVVIPLSRLSPKKPTFLANQGPFAMGFQLPEIDPAKKALTFFEEFKHFAFKGNVIDLAVGVIIGGAFGKIIDALVKKVIMPLIGAMTGGGAEGATVWAKKLTT